MNKSKKPQFKIHKKEYGDRPLINIIIEETARRLNVKKGYEFVRIKN